MVYGQGGTIKKVIEEHLEVPILLSSLYISNTKPLQLRAF